MAFSLVTLSIATVLNLVPPAATKVVVDYVLIGKPVPEMLTERGLPADPRKLLVAIALGIMGLAAAAIVITGAPTVRITHNRSVARAIKAFVDPAGNELRSNFSSAALLAVASTTIWGRLP